MTIAGTTRPGYQRQRPYGTAQTAPAQAPGLSQRPIYAPRPQNQQPAAPPTLSGAQTGSTPDYGGLNVGLRPTAPALGTGPLADYITGNFLFRQQDNENSRRLTEYDAESLRAKQEVEAQQALRRQALEAQLGDLGRDSAGDLASRGLLRSGLNFQAQDRINEFGVGQEQEIAQLLTNLVQQRNAGRLAQEQANRAALNDIISKLTGQFNAGQTIG